MPLTDLEVKRLKPTEKPKKISDGGGLYLLVTPGGSKLWRLNYRIGTTQKTLAFGPYPETSLAEARAMRERAKQVLGEGKDPSIKGTLEAPAGDSFEAVATEWLNAQSAVWSVAHIAFTIATENGGTDEDGEPITLPRCNPMIGSPTKVKRLPPQAVAALKILENFSQPISRDDWKRACMASDTVCGKESAETRRKAFDRALETLAREEWITFNNGFYSILDGFAAQVGHGQRPDNAEMSDTTKRQNGGTDTDTPL